mmetsp:Transcript_29805/g.104826  ORF Transcript_29805/g.104826 Transcript_29805/m.104826 type:complete len:201 (+) Transcript_29805:3628-4230(+)
MFLGGGGAQNSAEAEAAERRVEGGRALEARRPPRVGGGRGRLRRVRGQGRLRGGKGRRARRVLRRRRLGRAQGDEEEGAQGEEEEEEEDQGVGGEEEEKGGEEAKKGSEKRGEKGGERGVQETQETPAAAAAAAFCFLPEQYRRLNSAGSLHCSESSACSCQKTSMGRDSAGVPLSRMARRAFLMMGSSDLVRCALPFFK